MEHGPRLCGLFSNWAAIHGVGADGMGTAVGPNPTIQKEVGRSGLDRAWMVAPRTACIISTSALSKNRREKTEDMEINRCRYSHETAKYILFTGKR